MRKSQYLKKSSNKSIKSRTFSKFIILIFTLIIISAGVYLAVRSKNTGEKERSEGKEIYLAKTPLFSEKDEKIKIKLFFLSEEESMFHLEEREIFKSTSISNQAKQVIIETIKGSKQGLISPVPPETKLRELFISKDGTAFVNLSTEFSDGIPGGTTSELSAIYCIVNSLAYNFPTIEKVKFLIDGIEKETLKGHIDLTKSFFPDFSNVHQLTKTD
ncbi:MAG: GerMN domain-containing protein [Acidobacteriota bacterium]